MSLSKQELKIVLKAAVVTLKREFNKRSVVVKEELPADAGAPRLRPSPGLGQVR